MITYTLDPLLKLTKKITLHGPDEICVELDATKQGYVPAVRCWDGSGMVVVKLYDRSTSLGEALRHGRVETLEMSAEDREWLSTINGELSVWKWHHFSIPTHLLSACR